MLLCTLPINGARAANRRDYLTLPRKGKKRKSKNFVLTTVGNVNGVTTPGVGPSNMIEPTGFRKQPPGWQKTNKARISNRDPN